MHCFYDVAKWPAKSHVEDWQACNLTDTYAECYLMLSSSVMISTKGRQTAPHWTYIPLNCIAEYGTDEPFMDGQTMISDYFHSWALSYSRMKTTALMMAGTNVGGAELPDCIAGKPWTRSSSDGGMHELAKPLTSPSARTGTVLELCWPIIWYAGSIWNPNGWMEKFCPIRWCKRISKARQFLLAPKRCQSMTILWARWVCSPAKEMDAAWPIWFLVLYKISRNIGGKILQSPNACYSTSQLQLCTISYPSMKIDFVRHE